MLSSLCSFLWVLTFTFGLVKCGRVLGPGCGSWAKAKGENRPKEQGKPKQWRSAIEEVGKEGGIGVTNKGRDPKTQGSGTAQILNDCPWFPPKSLWCGAKGLCAKGLGHRGRIRENNLLVFSEAFTVLFL